MVLFMPKVRVYCQNDEVSTDVHMYGRRDERQISLWSIFLTFSQMPTLAYPRPDILNGLEITRFAGDYD